MTTVSIFQQVAGGQLSPDKAAELLMPKRTPWTRRKPEWMPRWAFITCGLLVSVVIAPLVFGRDERK
jgi:hypothetical protein